MLKRNEHKERNNLNRLRRSKLPREKKRRNKLKKVLLEMSTKHKCLEIQLRRTMDLRLRRNQKKVIYSRIYLESKRMSPRKKNLKDNNLNLLQSIKSLSLKKIKVYLITSLVAARTPTTSRHLNSLQENHKHSKTNIIRRQVKLQTRLWMRCSKTRNSRKKAGKQCNQLPAQRFSTNSV